MMISTFRSTLLAAVLAFAPVAATLHAQTAERVQVNIPFAFQNDSQVFAAGVYTLTASGNRLTIQGRGSNSQVMSMIEASGATTATGKVVFQRYGSKYFLREVWPVNESTHVVCIKTGAEKKAMKSPQPQSASANNAPTSAIEIATVR